MKKVVVHRRREGPKQHPWLVFTGGLVGAGVLVALIVYLVAGRETPKQMAVRLTRELADAIGRLKWDEIRQKMNIPEDVPEERFSSYITERHQILIDQDPVLLASEFGEAKALDEDLYEVAYTLHFHFRRTDREKRSKNVARWKYDAESKTMTYVIDDETKEALGIKEDGR